MSKDIDTLSLVKEAFAHWRTTRLKQGKIPDYLWDHVRELLNNYPIAKICSTLSISSVQIREKLLPKEDVAIQFVEVKEPLSVVTMQPASKAMLVLLNFTGRVEVFSKYIRCQSA